MFIWYLIIVYLMMLQANVLLLFFKDELYFRFVHVYHMYCIIIYYVYVNNNLCEMCTELATFLKVKL